MGADSANVTYITTTSKKQSIFDENKKQNKRNIKEMLQRTQEHMGTENATD